MRDPVIEAAIQGHTPDMSIRFLPYRFLQASGLTHKTIQQIVRARRGISLLEQGTPILDTAFEQGYFDQAYLANPLKRVTGKTLRKSLREACSNSLRFANTLSFYCAMIAV